MKSDQKQYGGSSDDGSLLEGFRKSDGKTLEIIYANNYRNIEAYVVKNSGQPADAKDVFQEAIMTAWLNVQEGNFTPTVGGTLEGYIYRIAQFKWLDRLKSKLHRSTVFVENTDAVARDESLDELPIDEAAMRKTDEKLEALKNLFDGLDEKCATILKGFYYGKKSLQEIGRELGHDSATIKTFKYRCMRKLKSLRDKI